MTNMYLLLAGLLGISLIVLIFGLIFLKGLDKSKRVQVKRQVSQEILLKMYNLCIKVPFLKGYISRVKSRIELIQIGDERSNKKKTMRIVLISFTAMVSIFLVLALVIHDIYYLIIVSTVLVLVQQHVHTYFFDRLSYRLTIQFEKFLTDVRHHYHEHNMIEEAIYDTIEGCPYEMSLHANRMYEVLTSTDLEGEMDMYYESVPDKFFKTFLALCYLVMKFGDRQADNQSVFLLNLNYLKQEINFEVLKMNRLNYIFKSLTLIVLVPIFFIQPLKTWAVSNISEMKVYYDGVYGFVVEVIILLLVIICFALVQAMRHKKEIMSKPYTLETLIMAIPGVKKLIDTMSVHNYTKTVRLSKVIKYSEVGMNLHIFYSRKIVLLILTLVVSNLLFINIHNIRKDNIIENRQWKHEDVYSNRVELPQVTSFYLDWMYGYNEKDIKELDGDIGLNFPMSSESFQKYLSMSISIDIQNFRGESYNWMELLFSIILCLLFYKLPDCLLIYKSKLMEMEKEDEVMQFHTIILMLMHIEQMTVEDILLWLEQFSILFKGSLGKCLNDIEHGDMEALEQLKVDEPYIPFMRIVDNLILASSKIAIVDAFDELRIERNYYLDKRKQDNNKVLNQKELMGKLIAFVPLVATIFLYLLIPIILFSYEQFIDFTTQTKEYLFIGGQLWRML